MGEDVNRLRAALATMNDEQRSIAQLYIDRITQMEGLFQLAQVLIGAILLRVGDGLDFAQLLTEIAETTRPDNSAASG